MMNGFLEFEKREKLTLTRRDLDEICRSIANIQKTLPPPKVREQLRLLSGLLNKIEKRKKIKENIWTRMRKIKNLKVCGECAYYHKRAFGEAICLRTGRIIPYLAQRECWAEIGSVKIEDIGLTKIKKSELPPEKIVNFEIYDTYDEED